MIIIYIITGILFFYLAVCVVYLLFFAIAGRLGKAPSYETHKEKASIAVIIPSYREDNIIVDTAIQALKQDYGGSYKVVVVADSLQPETIIRLKALPINVVEVSFEKSAKAKSLNAAFSQLSPSSFDLALILDADNIMSQDCLEKINHAYQSGWKVIQCHRTAKNKNTPVAILDALSEEINNTIFRRGHRVAGFSCTLIGSGMAFSYDLIRNIFAMPEIQDNPGEDREVDMQLIRQGILVEYLDDALIYDEKVQRKEVFEKQRTRWLGTHIQHLSRYFKPDLRHRFTSVLWINKVFQNLILPRLLFILVFFMVLVLAVIDLISSADLLFPSWPWWIACFIGYLFSMLFAIPASFYRKETAHALLQVPTLAVSMIKALLKIGQNKREFIHTPKEFSQ